MNKENLLDFLSDEYKNKDWEKVDNFINYLYKKLNNGDFD